MSRSARVALAPLVGALIAAACGGAPAPAALPSASPAPASASVAPATRTVVVAIRMEAPPANRTAGDPAHAQKRAFEAAIAALVVGRVAPGAKLELRSAGADRTSFVERGEADLAMTIVGKGTPGRVAHSVPFAAGGIVLAVAGSSPVTRLEDLRGKVIAVAMDELGAPEAAERYLNARGVEATLQVFQGVRGAAGAVASGSAAALVGDRSGVAVIEKAQPSALRVVEEVEERAYVIGVARSAGALLERIDAALAELLAAGEVSKAAETAGFPYERPR